MNGHRCTEALAVVVPVAVVTVAARMKRAVGTAIAAGSVAEDINLAPTNSEFITICHVFFRCNTIPAHYPIYTLWILSPMARNVKYYS